MAPAVALSCGWAQPMTIPEGVPPSLLPNIQHAIASPAAGTPLSVLQLLVSAAMGLGNQAGLVQSASQAAHAAALLWPQDLSQERRALETQHWVPSFPAAAAAGTAGGAAAMHQAEQPCQPLAVEMAAWLAEHCPEAGIADLQRWALTLRICTLTSMPRHERPEQLVMQVLCECQRAIDASPAAAAAVSARPAPALLAASASCNLARYLEMPGGAARGKRLKQLEEAVRDEAIATKCE